MRDYVTLVFGLPRSGTSCLCQMLDAGGIPVLRTKDFPMPPNKWNAHGYWEYEPVRQLRQNNSWVYSAIGKAVKLFVGDEQFLPLDIEYRAIVPLRDRNSTLTSWRALAPHAPHELDGRCLDESLAWIDSQPNWQKLLIHFENMLASPRREAWRLSEFLDGIDCDRAAAVVDPTLKQF